MVSKKSKPIKKVKVAKRKHKVVRHRREPGYWKVLTIVLSVLVVISVYTNGFRFNKIANSIADLNQLLAKETGEETKNSLKDAINSLESAKNIVAKEPAKEVEEFKGEKVKLEFYIMSQCPYGTQVEDAVKPALDLLGDSVDFSLNFISTDLGDGTFRSLHGEPETQGNIVELCAIKYNPDIYMDMVVCMNENARSIPDNWEECANKNNLDVEKIKACYESDEGKQLLSESIKKTNQVGATGSPTMFLNGQPYSGNRDTQSFIRALCANLEDHPACESLPACSADSDCPDKLGLIGKCKNPNSENAECEYVEPEPINLILINDKKCVECSSISRLTDQLKAIFKGLKVTEYDFEDSEGRRLYDDLNLGNLPVFLFDDTVENGEGYANVQQYLEVKGDYTSLRIGATFNPLAEICNNGQDDRDNDGLVDCDDDECSAEWQCLAKKDIPEVELFVMSHCPFGTQMEKGILSVIELLGDKIDFNIRFLYYAMHGEKEVTEQTNQYCIQKEQNDKFIPYLKCFLEAGDTDSCLAKAEIDTDMLNSCVAETDEEFDLTKNLEDTSSWLSGRYPLFNTDKDLNTKYDVGGSPTLVINEVVASAQRDPASLLDAVCTGFSENPEECSETLSSSPYSSGFGFNVDTGGSAASESCG